MRLIPKIKDITDVLHKHNVRHFAKNWHQPNPTPTYRINAVDKSMTIFHAKAKRRIPAFNLAW